MTEQDGDTITDEEFFDLLDDFAGPMIEMEWTMSDEEYERRHTAWWTQQKKESEKREKKREETREERIGRLTRFYHNESNIVNECSPFDD